MGNYLHGLRYDDPARSVRHVLTRINFPPLPLTLAPTRTRRVLVRPLSPTPSVRVAYSTAQSSPSRPLSPLEHLVHRTMTPVSRDGVCFGSPQIL